MDLMHQFCLEFLGINDLSVLASPSAKAVWDTFSTIKGHELFEQVPNTPTGVPQEGNILLWTNAPYGHVAIFVEGDTNSFRSFDQNFPTGSPCHIQNHTYANVAGWLRFKGSSSLQSELDKTRLERDRNWNWFTQVCDALGVGANVDSAVAEAKKLIGLDDILVEKDKKIQELQVNISTVEAELAGKTAMLTAFSDKNKELEQHVVQLTEAVAESQKKIDSALLDNKSLADTVQELKNALQEPLESATATIWRGIRKLFHL